MTAIGTILATRTCADLAPTLTVICALGTSIGGVINVSSVLVELSTIARPEIAAVIVDLSSGSLTEVSGDPTTSSRFVLTSAQTRTTLQSQGSTNADDVRLTTARNAP